MNIFNNWRAFLITGVILSFLLQRYTDLGAIPYLFIGFALAFIYDFVFDRNKKE